MYISTFVISYQLNESFLVIIVERIREGEGGDWTDFQDIDFTLNHIVY